MTFRVEGSRAFDSDVKIRVMSDYVHAPVEIPSSLMDDLKKFNDLFEVTREVADLGNHILARLRQQRDGTGFQSDLETAAYAVFGKSFKTFHSVRILCLHGCGTDALALCGSLFENLLDLMYIRQDPVPRARSYIAFEQVDKFYQAKKVLSRRDLPDEKRKTYEGYLRSLTPQVQAHLGMFPVQSCWWKSAGEGSRPVKVTLRNRAEAVGFGVEYDTRYYIFCGFKHTGPAAAAGYMFRMGEEVDVIMGPNIKGVYDAALHSAMYFLDLCGVFQDVYGLGMEAEVKALNQKLTKTDRRILKAHPHNCE